MKQNAVASENAKGYHVHVDNGKRGMESVYKWVQKNVLKDYVRKSFKKKLEKQIEKTQGMEKKIAG